MNLTTMVVIIILFGLSLNTIVGVGIAPPTGGLPTPPLPNAITTITWPNFNSIAHSVAGCNNVNGTSSKCSVTVGIASTLWATVLTFGYFFWGVVQLVPILFETILIPSAFMSYYGFPSQIINMYNTAMIILYVYFLYTLITGRYNATTE